MAWRPCLAVLEGLWLLAGKPQFRNLYLFWVKIFARSFGTSGVHETGEAPFGQKAEGVSLHFEPWG